MKKRLIITLIAFAILSIILLARHEPWRDEAEAWLIARDSPTLFDMAKLLPYEGTPGLWHLGLFAMAKSGLPYASMFILNFAFIIAAVFLFLRNSHFSTLEKALFSFSYYVFYEYGIIARNYAISILLLFALASLYKVRSRHPLLFTILAVLLANTNLHCLLISGVILAVFFYELLFEEKRHRVLAICIAIAAIGFIFAMVQMIPPKDLSPLYSGWNIGINEYAIGYSANALFDAFLRLPPLQLHFWKTNLLYNISLYTALLGVPVFIFSIGFFLKKLKPLLIYLGSSILMLILFAFKHPGSVRHHGLIFMTFIFCLWISEDYKENGLPISSKLVDLCFSKKALKLFLILLLSLQVLSSAIAFYYDYRYEFSGAKKASQFLIGNNYIRPDVLITSYPSSPAEATLPYFPAHAKFYYLEYQDFMSAMVNNKVLFENSNLTAMDIMSRINVAIGQGEYTEVLFITNAPVEDQSFLGRYALIFSDDATIVPTESFYVYKRI